MAWVQLALLLAVVVAITPLLGGYMAKVFAGERVLLSPVAGPLERTLLRLIRVRREVKTVGPHPVRRGDDGDPDPSGLGAPVYGPVGQDWKAYATSVLLFSFASWLLLYLLLRLQGSLPGDRGVGAAPWDVTFNTASSFVTNTNWQYYAGETTLSNVAQMVGLTVQNFVSAAVGIVVLIAVVRGIAARNTDPADRRAGSLGNFWVDLVRAVVYVLLPISILGALVFVTQGALQTLGGPTDLHTVAGGTQTLFRGPVASQEVIKLLGTNGGGFFNVNSAMPFENPTAFSNFFSMVLVLAIPAALTATYGRMVGNRRQGWAVFGAMALMFVVLAVVITLAEQHGSPAQHAAGLITSSADGTTGGNLLGKEQRFGIGGSSLFNAVTTVTSTGAVNSSMESLTGLGGLVPMIGMGSSEVIFGGVGSGLYGMLLFIVLAVFVGGLMVGRTPELHGKKIEAREIKLAMLGALYMPLAVLTATALAVGTDHGKVSNSNGGPQGFSESFYASLSQGNNNGSAFAGYTGFVQPDGNNHGAFGITFADLIGGLSMLFVRCFPILIVLAIAGSLVRKRAGAGGAFISAGTLRTDSPTFVVLLIGVIVLVGALTFFPAFLLGPVVQSLTGDLY
ncbi:potassium-transporting ATPase subunit KdpA [Patulibacter sp. NPDC049589]|uniref:potassium-transporting ATPase subunit KdpA n=1 Tax=Patulibacter sp. NPDC049589 TaxID=3154731 RepID=UPI0034441CAA